MKHFPVGGHSHRAQFEYVGNIVSLRETPRCFFDKR